jgi:hypothetical protein
MSRVILGGILGVKKRFEPFLENQMFWFNAESLNLSNNDKVQFWEDLSNYNIHATQAIEVNAPIFKKNVLNGKAGILYDGSNMRLVSSAMPSAVSQPNTIYAVVNFLATIHKPYSFYDGINSVNRHFYFRQDQALNRRTVIFSGSSLIQVGTAPDGTFYISKNIYNGVNSIIEENKQTLITGNSGTQSFLGLTIGSRFEPLSGDWQSLNGHICEIIGYNRLLTEEEDNQVYNYLQAKYNL